MNGFCAKTVQVQENNGQPLEFFFVFFSFARKKPLPCFFLDSWTKKRGKNWNGASLTHRARPNYCLAEGKSATPKLAMAGYKKGLPAKKLCLPRIFCISYHHPTTVLWDSPKKKPVKLWARTGSHPNQLGAGSPAPKTIFFWRQIE